MIDRHGGDGQAIALIDAHRAAICREGEGFKAVAGRINIVRAMMGDPVGRIQRIGFVEPGSDTLDAFGTIQRQRCVRAACRPMLQHHFAKPIDMIGMEMRQEGRFDLAPGQAKLAETAA